MEERRRTWTLLVAVAAALFLNGAAWAGSFKGLAKDLSRAARDSGITRVAVLPFEPADGSNAAEGWNISEKLVTQIVRQRRFQAVERSFLRKLMEEHSLGRSGVLDPSTLRKVGKIFGVDGVITGSFVTMGSEALLNARFIDVETGVILAAEECKVDRDWLDLFAYGVETGESGGEPFDVPAPLLFARAPHAHDRPQAEERLRDALSDESCENAAGRVDRMESTILDLKSRYWALRLRKGLPGGSLESNPGSFMTDPELKKRFYDRMRFWYGQAAIPELTPSEVKRFVAIDQRAFILHRKCGT
ncbi:MAG: CsgG/HfaB family protein [Elusimicrobiota bacterium]